MITRIEVSGFKSLKDFSLNFASGLNILVGPNGAGKTNIVSFFEFLAQLMETDASEATSRVGGAGAVFRRIENDYEKNINVRLVGCVSRPHTHRSSQPKEDPMKKIGNIMSMSIFFRFCFQKQEIVFFFKLKDFNFDAY